MAETLELRIWATSPDRPSLGSERGAPPSRIVVGVQPNLDWKPEPYVERLSRDDDSDSEGPLGVTTGMGLRSLRTVPSVAGASVLMEEVAASVPRVAELTVMQEYEDGAYNHCLPKMLDLTSLRSLRELKFEYLLVDRGMAGEAGLTDLRLLKRLVLTHGRDVPALPPGVTSVVVGAVSAAHGLAELTRLRGLTALEFRPRNVLPGRAGDLIGEHTPLVLLTAEDLGPQTAGATGAALAGASSLFRRFGNGRLALWQHGDVVARMPLSVAEGITPAMASVRMVLRSGTAVEDVQFFRVEPEVPALTALKAAMGQHSVLLFDHLRDFWPAADPEYQQRVHEALLPEGEDGEGMCWWEVEFKWARSGRLVSFSVRSMGTGKRARRLFCGARGWHYPEGGEPGRIERLCMR